jgi:hypothetical protein
MGKMVTASNRTILAKLGFPGVKSQTEFNFFMRELIWK